MKTHSTPAALARTRSPNTATRWLGLFAGLLLLSLMVLAASPARAADDPVDPPDRVGRLSELVGQVWVYAPESNEWIAASRNRPVTTGDRLSTEGDGRAEIRVGSSIVRLDGNTELEVLQLDDEHFSLQLHSGSATARLRTRDAANQFGLLTEEGRFVTERPGSYRFDRIDDTSTATVVSGQLQYEGDNTGLAVQPGQRVEFWKEGGRPQYSVTSPKRDDFSNWVAARDQREERSVSTRYVSPEMTGVEDLDRYGRWDQTEDYGAVWVPRQVAPGWAPYRMGHWAWVSPWGWTWVDDAPWGFAPFHYGRWVYYRDNWCWTPGRYAARPVYSPALVAWVGGPAVSVSVTVGRPPTVGWFPLGPREIYVPNYRTSPRYVREVNVTHVTNITNVNVTNIINNPNQVVANTRYVNRGIPNAVTVVPANVIERRQPVAPAARNVNDRDLRDFARERPRVDAPVAAPPRGAPAPRRIEDPRTGRETVVATPGGAKPAVPPSPRWQRGGVDGNRNNANGVGRENGRGPGGNGAEPAVPRAQQPQSPQQPQQDAARDAQARPANPTPGDRERDRNRTDRDRGGREVPNPATAPAAGNAQPPVNTAVPQAQPRQPGQGNGPRGGDDRGRTPTPPVTAAPTPAAPAVAQPPGQQTPRQDASDRQPAVQREGRARHHEMPGPPRVGTQAPTPAPQAQPPQVQQVPQPRPQPQAPAVQAPPAQPAVRAPEPRREVQQPERPRVEERRQEQRNEQRGGERQGGRGEREGRNREQ